MPIELDLVRLRQFLAVAEALSFTRASERLQIAQPALSRQISRLEKDLGALLFDRTRRQVQLTPAGRALLVHTRALMELSARTRRDVDRAARGEIGEIVVGFTPTVGGSLLPEAIRSFRRRHPGITIDLREIISTEREADLLMRDEIDVSLRHYPSTDRVFVRSELIASEPYSLVALPADHRLAAKRTVGLRDLWPERIIVGPASNPSADEDAQLAQDVARAARSSVPPEVIHTNDAMTRLVLVATGVGVTLLLGSGPRITHPGIVYRPLTGSRQRINLYASLRADERATHVLRFVEDLRSAGRELAARPAAETTRTASDGRG